MDERVTLLLKMVRDKYGQRLRYPKDAELLSNAISDETGMSLSASTLRRLFGMEKRSTSPRLETLDILASFLGYATIDDFYARVENDELVDNHS